MSEKYLILKILLDERDPKKNAIITEVGWRTYATHAEPEVRIAVFLHPFCPEHIKQLILEAEDCPPEVRKLQNVSA